MYVQQCANCSDHAVRSCCTATPYEYVSLYVDSFPMHTVYQLPCIKLRVTYKVANEFESVRGNAGGQKHRVALARACYADAGVVLLDDPLSAVDAHVQRKLMQDVVCGVLGKATRVLVTHQLQFLPQADLVVKMEHGRIVAAGTYHELVAQGVELHTNRSGILLVLVDGCVLSGGHQLECCLCRCTSRSEPS